MSERDDIGDEWEEPFDDEDYECAHCGTEIDPQDGDLCKECEAEH